MTYEVKYGFGKDQNEVKEKFLSNYHVYDVYETKNVFIYKGACFAFYCKHRIHNNRPESLVWYTLTCNAPKLKKLIEQINKTCPEIHIEIEKTTNKGYLASMNYFDNSYENYDIKRNSNIILSLENFKKNFNHLKKYPIAVCILSIKVNCDNFLAKTIIEYLLLVFIRQLDVEEEYIKALVNTKDAIKDVLDASITRNDNHSIYDSIRIVGRSGNINISKPELLFCLNPVNVISMVKSEDEEHLIYKTRQTGYINKILGRSEENNYVSSIFQKAQQ